MFEMLLKWCKVRTEKYTMNLVPWKLLINFVRVVLLKWWGHKSDWGVRDENIRTMSTRDSFTYTYTRHFCCMWPSAKLIHSPDFIIIIINLSSSYLCWRNVVRIKWYDMERCLKHHEHSINADSFHFSHLKFFKINLLTRVKHTALTTDYKGVLLFVQ